MRRRRSRSLRRGRVPPAVAAAIYWSKELNCTVRYSKPNEIFIFLKEEIVEEHKYLNVLFGDKHGWIVYKDWLEITKAKTNGF